MALPDPFEIILADKFRVIIGIDGKWEYNAANLSPSDLVEPEWANPECHEWHVHTEEYEFTPELHTTEDVETRAVVHGTVLCAVKNVTNEVCK